MPKKLGTLFTYWQEVARYTENGRTNITVLQSTLRADEWIAAQQKSEQEADGLLDKFRLKLTNDEKELVFNLNENEVLDKDGIENKGELLENFMDDSFVLDI
ncbi:hypothetical protein L873DRAFT_1791452 [Choiromyces venosus 120613-1]|uniref:Uncharacterized protein n=1 Tax=Choiromyces venosus 120613-1 TaxID=1336337 RepID=A0A3N4JH81_9PEZI|nr:hypothetical protein L873DRAFT_1791452 [Choiromyces venosus 120613-1]